MLHGLIMISYATCVTCCLYYLPCDSHKVNQNQYVEGLYSNIWLYSNYNCGIKLGCNAILILQSDIKSMIGIMSKS